MLPVVHRTAEPVRASLLGLPPRVPQRGCHDPERRFSEQNQSSEQRSHCQTNNIMMAPREVDEFEDERDFDQTSGQLLTHSPSLHTEHRLPQCPAVVAAKMHVE